MEFKILYKAKTSRGANYYKLDVEVANGLWESAVYFGNTTPKKITKLSVYGDGFIADIQSHTSRDMKTGRFKAGRR